MICSSSSPPIRRRPGEGRGPRGFTLVELLVVIVILAILIALLLPAINGALRTARNAAVGGEINQLAQALASFKAKYGDYPPSRIYLAEDGNLRPARHSTPIAGAGDITLRAARPAVARGPAEVLPEGHLQHHRRRCSGPQRQPVVRLQRQRQLRRTQPYILQGHECLVFFLGGIPLSDSSPAELLLA